jgi:CBS domain-containing protein
MEGHPMSSYRILNAGALDVGTGIERPRQALPARVTLDSPAVDVMTDLSRVAAEAIPANVSVDYAEARMIASGVRLLFVTNQNNEVVGIITARDLSGERIMRFVTDSNSTRRDIIVRDIMTPQHRVEVLDMSDVSTARVGDIVATLKRMGRQHALVVDHDSKGRQLIRGVLSTSQVGRQLGESIDTADFAGSFADLARAG